MAASSTRVWIVRALIGVSFILFAVSAMFHARAEGTMDYAEHMRYSGLRWVFTAVTILLLLGLAIYQYRMYTSGEDDVEIVEREEAEDDGMVE
jgi:heme/copper-type cytochrome/quinol oxidase subunit 2